MWEIRGREALRDGMLKAVFFFAGERLVELLIPRTIEP